MVSRDNMAFEYGVVSGFIIVNEAGIFFCTKVISKEIFCFVISECNIFWVYLHSIIFLKQTFILGLEYYPSHNSMEENIRKFCYTLM